MKNLHVLILALATSASPALWAEGTAPAMPVLAGITTSDSAQTVHVSRGRSVALEFQQPLKRVSVSDPAVASATIVSPKQVLVHGLQPGGITLMLWNLDDSVRSYELEVDYDLEAVQSAMDKAFVGSKIQCTQSGGAIVLAGQVSSKAMADNVLALAQAYGKNVVNLLGAPSDQVMLQVRFAEVDRTAIQQLGLNVFSTNGVAAGNISTQQFQQTVGSIGSVPANIQRGRDPNAPTLVAGGKDLKPEDSPSVFGLGDLLNLFAFSPDLNIGATLRALKQKNVLEILAEPNLLARSGKTASFLAGGEFPFPTVHTSTTGFPAIAIEFREFGVRLKFTPEIYADETIGLQVAQEVSSLDFANALTISGFVVPALSTRRAETEVHLRDGQSFAIAGLIDNRLSDLGSKLPGLGDLPVIGKLFQSQAKKRDHSELLVLITPSIVKDPTVAPKLPSFPKPFLDPRKFDGGNGSGSGANGGR
jgi:pilus assembly protein CpaC